MRSADYPGSTPQCEHWWPARGSFSPGIVTGTPDSLVGFPITGMSAPVGVSHRFLSKFTSGTARREWESGVRSQCV
jgi:hypothetical protein